MIGAWQFAGDRFVATRRLKDLRYPADTDMAPDPLTGSYLAIYWVLDGHHDEWNRWAVDQVNWLHANGRMFDERQHIHTLLDNWFQQTYLPEVLQRPWGPDVVSSATVIPLLADRPSDVIAPAAGPSRFLQLHFLDHDPA